jgi:hypothetical protein
MGKKGRSKWTLNQQLLIERLKEGARYRRPLFIGSSIRRCRQWPSRQIPGHFN